VNIIRNLLGLNSSDESEMKDLRRRLDESEQKIEKLLEMINILATFDERLAKDVRTVASHVALMEMSIMNKQKQGAVTLRRKSNDDDIIN
jgi:hypothetical protein